jgi:hypothetical protein
MPVRGRTCEDAKALRTPRNTLVLGTDTRTRVDSTRTCVLRCRGSGTALMSRDAGATFRNRRSIPVKAQGRSHNQGGCGEKVPHTVAFHSR